MLLIGMCECVNASMTTHATADFTSFTMYVFNGGRITEMVKLSQFSQAVQTQQPHSFVISETKTQAKLSNSLPFHEYEIFEKAAQPSTNFHTFKWGVILGIQKDIQIVQHITAKQQSLKGRMAAVDVVLQTLNGRAFTH